jgi:hypothetical protein
MNETDPCRSHVISKLKNSGWKDDSCTDGVKYSRGRKAHCDDGDLQKKYNRVRNTVRHDSQETLMKALKPSLIDPAVMKRQELRLSRHMHLEYFRQWTSWHRGIQDGAVCRATEVTCQERGSFAPKVPSSETAVCFE